jgi:hypothetical protein
MAYVNISRNFKKFGSKKGSKNKKQKEEARTGSKNKNQEQKQKEETRTGRKSGSKNKKQSEPGREGHSGSNWKRIEMRTVRDQASESLLAWSSLLFDMKQARLGRLE